MVDGRPDGANGAAPKRPNILLVIADQLSALATEPYGNPDVLTPHLARLAERGVVFDHAYCNAPICGPARMAMVTGQLSGRLPVYDNSDELPAQVPTFMHHFRRAGYRTILSGKMHFVGPDQLHGFEERLTPDIYPADYTMLKSWEAQGESPRIVGIPGDPESEERYNTFDMARCLKHAGPVPWSEHLDYDEEVHYHTLAQLRAFGHQRGTPEERPWLLCASYIHPHDPPVITPEYWDRYEGRPITPPASPPPGHRPHVADQWVDGYHGIPALGLTPEEVLRARRGYYAMTSYFDDKVGELLGELRRFGMERETIVIVLSDHGDMVGERGMWFKRTFYEWCVRVPLIVALPDGSLAGRRVAENVSLVDLYPSLLDLAGIPFPPDLPHELDGRSFVPLMREETAGWPNAAIVENNNEGTLKPTRTLVRDRYKYVYVHDRPPLLYDLERDPLEWRNVVDDPEYAEIAASLRDQLLAGWDGAETERKILESQRRRIFLKSALERGRFTPWDYQPFQDASRRYVRRALPPAEEAIRPVVTGREVPAGDGRSERAPRRIMRT